MNVNVNNLKIGDIVKASEKCMDYYRYTTKRAVMKVLGIAYGRVTLLMLENKDHPHSVGRKYVEDVENFERINNQDEDNQI
jgi:hypothetical protein